MKEWIKIRIDADLKRAAIEYAEEHGTSVSALLRAFLESLTRDERSRLT